MIRLIRNAFLIVALLGAATVAGIDGERQPPGNAPDTRPADARPQGFRAVAAGVTRSLKAKVIADGPFTEALYKDLAAVLAALPDDPDGRQFLLDVADFAEGRTSDRVFAAYLREQLDVRLARLPGPAADPPFRGMSLKVDDARRMPAYLDALDRIAGLGADAVQVMVVLWQENGRSNRVFADRASIPDDRDLGRLFDRAKARGLRVMVLPYVLLASPAGNEWRGSVTPDDWGEWFDSYRTHLVRLARLADAHGVAAFGVGCELVSSESRADQWKQTIAAVGGAFRGRLYYSANWDHYASIPFWDQLDLIGMNSYWKMGNNAGVTPAEIDRRWGDVQKELLAFQRKKGKPLLFTEVGWCSMANAAIEPWDYTKDEEPLDLDLQKRLYEGFFRAWHANPAVGGYFIYEWSVDGGGPKDRCYTPAGKPAEGVLRANLGKGPWRVGPPKDMP